ncbi:hypothetical protein [Pseudarthrobacter oxydans]|uniref:hypothetical protein n=1 Tax=Pseudarthrobacter oxydans TaxID=1671 RepID=UPI00342F8819
MTIGGRVERAMFGEKFMRRIACLAFAYILFLPVSQGNLLILIMGVCAGFALLTAMITGRALTTPIAAAFALTMLLGLYGLAVDSANPGFWNGAMIFVATPALFFLYISVLGGLVIRDLMHTCAVVTIALGACILVYVATQNGVLPSALFPSAFLEVVGAGYGEKDAASSVRFYGLSTLAAAAPMWLASLFVRKDDYLPGMKLRLAAAGFAVGAALVGGRRAIVLGLLLLPLVVWLLRRVVKRQERSGPRKYHPALVIGVLIAMAVLAPLTPSIVTHPAIANVVNSVMFYITGEARTIAADEAIRADQIDALITHWTSSPVFGHGIGALVPGIVRSDRQPWQFEAQYAVLLMQVGVVGMLIVGALAAVVLYATLRAAALRPSVRPTLIVVLVGGASMLIANATNPYLQAPAHHWAIFLPLAVINYAIREPESVVEPAKDLELAAK